jgi:cytoskeletal protein CcmA (bactofilin family)
LGKTKINTSYYDTVIGKNTTLEGNIACVGSVRVDGTVKGDIKVSGNLLVGDQGSITGSVEAVNVHLAGAITGNVHTYEVLKILSSARLCGDIKVKSFVADEGALFIGRCEMVIAEVEQGNKKRLLSRDKELIVSAAESKTAI